MRKRLLNIIKLIFFENIFLLFLNLTTVNSGQPFCETDEVRLDANYHQDDR